MLAGLKRLAQLLFLELSLRQAFQVPSARLCGLQRDDLLTKANSAADVTLTPGVVGERVIGLGQGGIFLDGVAKGRASSGGLLERDINDAQVIVIAGEFIVNRERLQEGSLCLAQVHLFIRPGPRCDAQRAQSVGVAPHCLPALRYSRDEIRENTVSELLMHFADNV
jgi:hypothetical protein